MRPTDNIEKLIKKLRYNPTPKTSDKLHENLLSAFENHNKQYSAPAGANIWRIIMKNKITKLTVAAVIIITAPLNSMTT